MENPHDCCLGFCWLDQGGIQSLMWHYYRYLKYEQRITVSSDRWPGYVENLPVIIVSKFSTLISHLLYLFSSLFFSLLCAQAVYNTVENRKNRKICNLRNTALYVKTVFWSGSESVLNTVVLLLRSDSYFLVKFAGEKGR